MAAIFSTRKEHLEVLKLKLNGYRYMGENEVKNVLGHCAKGTKCVEKLVLGGQTFTQDCLNELFEAHKHSLSHVTVEGSLLEGAHHSLEFPALKEVCLAGTMPEDAQKALEKRGVYCKVNAEFTQLPYHFYI